MERIGFENVKKEISEIFPSASLDDWALTPDSIHQFAATQGTELQWKKIPKWTDFEEGRIDFEESEFLEFAFYNHKPVGRVYLVTDNCFKKREAYSMDSNHLLSFLINMDQLDDDVPFVQPMDYVFVNPDQNLITLMHHEGQVTQYKRWF